MRFLNTICSRCNCFNHPRYFYKTIIVVIVLLSLLFVPMTTPLELKSKHSTIVMPDLNISLDCKKTNGIIKPFSEINCGPLPIRSVKNSVDLTKEYQELGIKFVRTHDMDNTFGACDISSIFPNWSANPSFESSYDFSNTDPYIIGIINAGCRVFYRLGESAGGPNIPPQNFSKWAEICKHIVMHYNDGWNNGFNFNITHWEIWNEPDLSGFWNGTAEQYYELYGTTVKTLKSYNSSLKIGGPCTSSVDNINFTSRFLEYVSSHGLPLDFFSWHMYADTPYQMHIASKKIRNLLDSYGFTECENINTEWNINILTPQRDKDNAKNAAFTSCCLTIFQDADIDYAFRYRGTQDNNWLMRLIGFDLSLFTYDGVYKKPALSYLALHHIIEDTPFRLNTSKIDPSTGITSLAGISEDKTNVSILISNYKQPDTPCTIEILNLPWTTSYNIVHYLIDDSHDFEVIEKKESNTTNFTLTKTIKQNTVHFIRLTNSTIFPSEGPKTADIPLILKLRFLDPLMRLLGILILILISG